MGGRRFSKKRKILLGLAVVAFVGVILGSSVEMGLLTGSPGRQPEGIGIEGAVTITLYGPGGQTLGVWKTHNSLVQPGITFVILCLSGSVGVLGNGIQIPSAACPGNQSGAANCFNLSTCPYATSTNPSSLTGEIGIATNSLLNLRNPCTNAYSACGLFATATITTLPTAECGYGTGVVPCTGWVASAVFGPSQLGCQTPTCTIADIASGWGSYTTQSVTQPQFDDIPSSNFPSTISYSAGDTLAINIQFTVS